MNEPRQVAVHEALVAYYDTHPINEIEILTRLRARGDDPDAITQAELKDFDQDHYGGTEAVDVLAHAAAIVSEDEVLDVCCGLGGPARWLAYTRGCRVTGIDLTVSRIDSARRLTERVGLADRVRFEASNACQMPFADARFDVVVGQEAWVHVPDKPTLLGECRRVLRIGGRMSFTDIVERAPLAPEETRQMADEMQFAHIYRPDEYQAQFDRLGFEVVEFEDLSETWTRILQQRLQMYLSLRDTTVARFGLAHHEHWARMYGAFVSLYEQRKLGGLRVLAKRRA